MHKDEIKSLCSLQTGGGSYIYSLNTDEEETRRLTDLGFTPGSYVTLVFKSPFGNPCAYRIMGGTIALRNETAEKILISVKSPESGEADL